MKGASSPRSSALREPPDYTHPSADLPLRPEVGTQAQEIAVKVIDDRRNELLVVRKLNEGK